MDPLVSVIVPIYKVEQYLHRCVDSILSQTYSNLEIILVDDGSPDNCGEICDNYAVKDLRISVIHKKNGGLGDARNFGILQASGDYIVHIDSDDFVTKNHIETLLNLCIKYNAEISICGTHYYASEADLKIPEELIKEIVFDSVTALKHMLYQREYDTSAWAKMYKRSLFDGVLYSDLYNEDLATTYKLMLKAHKVAYTSKKLYYYFQRPDSMMGAFSPKKLDILKISTMMQADIVTKYPALTLPLYSKIVSMYFGVALQMNSNEPNSRLLWEEIKKYRGYVLKDAQGRAKTRIACLISFLGPGAIKQLFKMIK